MLPRDKLADGAGRGSGVRTTSSGKAPDGVGKLAVSVILLFSGRKARKVQRSIQAKSTPRSVQDKGICVPEIASDGFMGTSSFSLYRIFLAQSAAGTAICLHIFKFSSIILDEAKL